MANYNIRVHSKLQHLRWKYRYSMSLYNFQDSLFSRLLNNLTIVYTNYSVEYNDIDRQYNNLLAKRKRYKSHLNKMRKKYGTLYLLTLTFGDCYDSTNTDTRKKYVLRFLNDYTLDYFGCLDIGKKGGREHYHVIVALDTTLTNLDIKSRCSSFYSFPELSHWQWGFSSCKLIASSQGFGEKSALSYSFKSALYSFKSADTNTTIKPFHKRGVDYSSPYFYNLVSDSSIMEWQ